MTGLGISLAKQGMQMERREAHIRARRDLDAATRKLRQAAQQFRDHPEDASGVASDLVNLQTSIAQALRDVSLVAGFNSALSLIDESTTKAES